MDKADRLVLPKPLRDRVGLSPEEVSILVDGVGIRIEPVSAEDVVEEAGVLVVPRSGAVVDDERVQALRDTDQQGGGGFSGTAA